MSGAFDFVGDLFGGFKDVLTGGEELKSPTAPPPAPEEDPAAVAARLEEAERVRRGRPEGRAANILAGATGDQETSPAKLLLG